MAAFLIVYNKENNFELLDKNHRKYLLKLVNMSDHSNLLLSRGVRDFVRIETARCMAAAVTLRQSIFTQFIQDLKRSLFLQRIDLERSGPAYFTPTIEALTIVHNLVSRWLSSLTPNCYSCSLKSSAARGCLSSSCLSELSWMFPLAILLMESLSMPQTHMRQPATAKAIRMSIMTADTMPKTIARNLPFLI